MDCIFCKIVNEEVPSYKVYENDNVVAFFDILPVSPGHTIVVPRKHVPDLEELPDADFCSLVEALKKVGRAMLDGLGVKGYSVYLDNKSAANQHVPHVHFHVVPRAEGDGLGRWPQSGYADGEAEKYLKKMKKEIK
jgi:histidine triad (HIT) family protein